MQARRRRPGEFKTFRNPASLLSVLERNVDDVVNATFRREPPEVLYHYTSWEGATGILNSNRIWATAHDCTNDRAELMSADEAVVRAVDKTMETAGRRCAALLDLALEGIQSDSHVRHVAPPYLACFSAARDKGSQWKEYGRGGTGLCLGFRLLDEPVPDDEYARALLRVNYSEPSVSALVAAAYRDIYAELESALRRGVPATNDTATIALSGMYRIGDLAAIGTKRPDWAEEEEWRPFAISKPGRDPVPLEREGPQGTIRFIELSLRADNRPLEIREILIGPSQDRAEAEERVRFILQGTGRSTGPNGCQIDFSKANSG